MDSLTALVNSWVSLAQGIVASIGTLALLTAFVYRIVAVDQRNASEAKRWIGRIVVGTVGAELAGTLTHALLATIPSGMH
ncbi:MAG: hypothetical protein ABSE52_11760 [Candidatus Dormibacteria bacterium]|jgi:hypothetical protein